ncbi:phenol hydroxylase subunit P4 [Dasania marina]|uniref:phenol hydroxylase subunit P4 n=1 Tax=Dasania marina TaxID=471499 RepID=UPI000371A1CE|nr:phenol hydroxylase subunit P4 [Dasania marina]
MTLKAIVPDYKGEVLDRIENFNGNQLLFINWDYHLFFCAPFAYAVAPDISFQSLLDNVISEAFSQHHEFKNINWQIAEWQLNGEPFIPQMDVSLANQGIDHKSLLRFQTPELQGYQGAHV